jgi:hypothetical protein
VAFSGVGNATYEDLPWWLQIFAKGGVTGVLSATTVYTYTFTPTATSDDLKTVTLEVGNDTQAYQIPYGLGEKLELSWQGGQPVKMSVDLLGQQLTAQSFTGALSDRTGRGPRRHDGQGLHRQRRRHDRHDAGANVLAGKITLSNRWQQITHLRGNLYPDDAQRDSRWIDFEFDIHFNNTTEFAQLLTGGERMIRVLFTGTTIAGSAGSIARTTTINLYGYHVSAPFATSNAIRTVKIVGNTQYDTTATTDWSIAVANALVTLP